MPSHTKRERKVKAYALVFADGTIPQCYNHAHHVFAPRIYSTLQGAYDVADTIETGGAKLEVVPCIITLPKKLNPKKKNK